MISFSSLRFKYFSCCSNYFESTRGKISFKILFKWWLWNGITQQNMKNMPLTSTITATNFPPKTIIGGEHVHYRMHCASWSALNDLMEMPQVKCWTAMHKIKTQRQTLEDRNTWLLQKAFVSKKANHFISVLNPSEKEDENCNAQCMDYQRLKPDNTFIISIPPMPDFLLTLFYS